MELSPKAKVRIATLLGGEAQAMMALDSNWADEIRDDRPETSPWHFINIEIADLAYACPGDNCVVGQIVRDEKILRSNATAPAKAEALKFLIHFVGDVHQPLHAGEDHDRGGNDIHVRQGRKRTNLHHIWDDDMVAVQGTDAQAVARGIDGALSPAQKNALAQGTPRDWAMESAGIAKSVIYRRLPYQIDERYERGNVTLARVQLARAGLRLAAMLNAIFR